MSQPNLEELERRALELVERNLENDPSIEQRLIGIYKSMLRQMNRQDTRYQPIKEKVIDHLIRYGTYMKSSEEKDLHVAEHTLEKVLKYDRSNAIASYRLGFIAYRHKKYSNALKHFENALKYHLLQENGKYRLTEQQQKNAYLYLTNSSLHVAKSTYEKMSKIFSNLPEKLSDYKFSELYRFLDDNEQYLESHAFIKETKMGVSYCSKEECEELALDNPEGTILLYFNDRNITVHFNGDEDILTGRNGNILRQLLTKTTRDRPATRSGEMAKYFLNGVVQEVNGNTYTAAIMRLRARLMQIGLPEIICTEERIDRPRPAYYYDHSLPFIVLYRVDDEFK